MYNKAIESVTLPPSIGDIPEQLFNDQYGLDASTYKSYKVVIPMMSGVITEIAVIEATDGNVEIVKAALEARLNTLKNGGAFYPSHVEIVQKGQIVTKDNFVMLVADEAVESIVANFTAAE